MIRGSLSTLLLVLALPATASAYPVVVRASSRIDLAMRHEGTRMAIDGRLTLDDGDPVAGATVTVAVASMPPTSVQTGPDGRFGWAFEIGFGEVDVVARFAGTETVEATSEQRRFQVGKDDVALDMAVPARIDRARTSVEVEVRARSGVGNGGLSVGLFGSKGHPLASGRTDATGLVRLTVTPRAIGTAGPVRLEARSAADALRGEGHAVAETMLVSRPRLSIGPVPKQVAADGEVTISGVLTDEERPIARGAVEVRMDRGPAVRVATDARGAFSAVVPVESLPTGPLELRVRYEPDAAWHMPVELGPIRIEHLAATPLAWWLLLVPLCVTALALLVVLRASRDRLSARRGRSSRQVPARVQGGLQPARPSEGRMRASRRPPDPEIAGRVWDPTAKKGVGGALVKIDVAGTSTTIACDASGRFATGPLPAGDVVLEASATGYLPESFTARVPHQGELRDFRIDLVPVRHRVMEIYRDAALQVLPERELWGFWTPRELLRFAKKRKEAREMPLQPLTDLFEEVYYAGLGATVEHVSRATDLAAAVGVRAPQ